MSGTPNPLIAESLARALGLPLTNCIGFTLVAKSDNTVTLKAEYFVLGEQAQSLITVAHEYILTPRPTPGRDSVAGE